MSLPRPAAWASAVALFVFASGVSVALAFIMPILGGLMRHAPRLAWLGVLIAWLAPIAVAATIHGAVDKALGRGGAGPAASLWAGFVAWAVIIVVTMTTAFVMLILNPPPLPPESVWNLAAEMTRGASGVGRSLLWIVLAAYAYELQLASADRG